jgi:hypothetical protein
MTLTYLLAYSIGQSPSREANLFAANQEIPHILWNPIAHYRIHKCPPHVHILSQFYPDGPFYNHPVLTAIFILGNNSI